MQCVYSDKWIALLERLGALQIERATSVEWESGEWVARLRDRETGEVIARGPNRAEVIRAEVAYLNARLTKGGGL